MKNKKIMSVFEIALLITASVSFSFVIGGVGDRDIIGEVIDFVDVIPSVSAQMEEKTGCCYDSDEGLCDPYALESACLARENGDFKEDLLCNVAECRFGCCAFGLNNQYVTQRRCDKLAELFGVPSNWDSSIGDEVSCVSQITSQEVGACVFSNNLDEGNNCVFTTQDECVGLTNDLSSFYKGFLCSNPSLETVCEKQDTTNCVDGQDEVYWFDSCGNRENIYSSSKDESWNEGMIKEESCNPNDSNVNSLSCGNCDYNLGSDCEEFREGIDTGDFEGYTCRDLNCYDAPGINDELKDRINGESWCVYDGPVGSGALGSGGIGDIGGAAASLIGIGSTSISRDLVGSGHYKYSCERGEVVSEACGDMRREICVENEETLDNGVKIKDAFCRVNMWEQCYAANGGLAERLSGTGLGFLNTKCTNNPDCRMHSVNVDSNFKFDMCVPNYPPGFNIGEATGLEGMMGDFVGSGIGGMGGGGSSGGGSNDICEMGSQTCTSTWKKSCVTGWKCIDNCDCHGAKFTTQLSNLCVSLGDCGIYPNIAGKTNLFMPAAKVSKKGGHGATPPPPLIMAPLFLAMLILPDGPAPDGGVYNEEEGILGLEENGLIDPFLSFFGFNGGSRFGGDIGEGSGWTNAGISVGAGVGTAVIFKIVGISLSSGPVGWIIAAVVIVVYALLTVFGCGEIETVEISYECKTWQPPPGGADCGLCDDDPLKPCSKYRCESLGTRCKLINEGTGVDECIAIEGDMGRPVITPWDDALNQTMFSYQTISTNGFEVRTADDECIQAFTLLSFGVQTDIHAICGWSLEAGTNISGMTSFLEGGIYTKNHTMITMLPSVDSLIANEVSNGAELDEALAMETEEGISVEQYLLDQIGDMNFHVKCANIDGEVNDVDYVINFCVDPGPDRTLPVVMPTVPPEDGILGFDVTEKDVVFFISEPSECRWSVTKPETTNFDEKYLALENEMDCVTNPEAMTGIFGYSCNATLPTLDDENEYYILCKDQPWLEGGEREEERNYGAHNGDIYTYSLTKSASVLSITDITPSGNIIAGTEPISVELTAKTSGGGYGGKAVCEWGNEDGEYVDYLFTDNNINHNYLFTSFEKGDKKIYLRCVDVAGNIATGVAEFTLELDTVFPEVTRVYNSGSDLVVLTNEPGTCYYGDNQILGCDFDLANASVMSGSGEMRHLTEWNVDKVHYIICEDVWGHRPNSCSMIVQPDELISG